jgi:hypothetical protein
MVVFWWELAERAWHEFIQAVGTTTLGFIVSLVVVPLVVHLLKVARKKASMKLESFMETALGVFMVYGAIYFLTAIFGVPHEIREQANKTPPPIYSKPHPPSNWDEVKVRVRPETIHSMVVIAKIACEPKIGIPAPTSDSGFTLLSGDSGATLKNNDDSRILLRPLSPTSYDVTPDTIWVIQRFVLEPGEKPDGQAIGILEQVETLSVKMVGWGFGPWCAHPKQADISLLVNGRSVWNKSKPIDERSTLEFSYHDH